MKTRKAPRTLSPRQLRGFLNFFPPWLSQGIRLVELDPGFRRCVVRVRRSWLTRNLQGTIFGGTIFAAADPMFAVLYWQIFAHRGIRIQAWVRSATVRYLKPAATALRLEFVLREEDVSQADEALEREGRYSRRHLVEAVDTGGVVCAAVEIEVYLRLPREDQVGVSAF